MERYRRESPSRRRGVSWLLLPLALELATCGGPPGVVVDIGSWPDQATSLRIDGALNGSPFTAPLFFGNRTTRFVVYLAEGESGQLSLALAALDGNGCPRATAQTQLAVGSGLRRIVEADVMMTAVAPPPPLTPRLDRITPAFGTNAAATLLTLSGSNFACGAAVSVGGVACSNVNVVSSTQLTCTLLARPGTCGPQSITVTNPDLQMASIAAGFSFFTSTFTLTAASPATQTVNTTPTRIGAADFNGDGKTDLVIVSYGSNNFSLLLGNSDGTFQAKQDSTTGTKPLDIQVGDLNGDMKADVVVSNQGSNTLSVFLGNGDGTFQAKQDTTTTATLQNYFQLADVNGDMKLDVIVGSQNSGNVYVLLGNGNGTLQASTRNIVPSLVGSLAVADFNGDQKPDIVTSGFGTALTYILMGNGDGTFQGNKVAGAVNDGPFAIGVGDGDGDGKLDLVVANSGSANVSLLRGNGDGTFQAKQDTAVGATPQGLWVGDLNGDGLADALIANRDGTSVSYLQSLGANGFAAAANIPVGNNPQGVLAVDFNGDKLPDVVAANTGQTTVSIFTQQCK